MSGAVGVRHWSHVIIHPWTSMPRLSSTRSCWATRSYLTSRSQDRAWTPSWAGRGPGRVVVGLVGGQKVEFVYLGDPDLGDPQDNERGLRGFTVRVADINEAADACTAHGVPILSGPSEIKGFWQFMIMDPDGVAIEISQTPPGVELSGPLS